MPIKIKEAYRTPNRLDPNKKSSHHIIIKTLNIQCTQRILRAAKEKGKVTCKSRPIIITPDFSLETMKARRFLVKCYTDIKRPQMAAQTTIPRKTVNCHRS